MVIVSQKSVLGGIGFAVAVGLLSPVSIQSLAFLARELNNLGSGGPTLSVPVRR